VRISAGAFLPDRIGEDGDGDEDDDDDGVLNCSCDCSSG